MEKRDNRNTKEKIGKKISLLLHNIILYFQKYSFYNQNSKVIWQVQQVNVKKKLNTEYKNSTIYKHHKNKNNSTLC